VKYVNTGYATLEGDVIEDERVENVKWGLQQSHRPDTDDEKGAEVYQAPPGDEVAIMLNTLTVAVIGPV
jgi:hypothetical protein